MRISAGLQMLACLMVYAPSAHAIMVKYGTSGGPIVPPTPEPELPPQQPYRVPAPVWEERSNDSPDPNAQWRPQFFIPQPRYTNVVYNNQPVTPVPQNNAQRFVNSYLPTQVPISQPVQVQPVRNYFTPSQVLSSQSLPGFGLRYFVPIYAKDAEEERKVKEDAQYNHITSNDVNAENRDAPSDLQWKYEKDANHRVARSTQQFAVPVHLWSVHAPRRHYQ
ncbi:GV1 isoform 2-T2 [Aphomia sociella]